LLQASVEDTLTHPLFGVGPGQFGNFEGREKSHAQGGFVNPHNSYTQISSETGLPGAFFYLAGIISSFLLLQRAWKRAASVPGGEEMATACFCLSVSYLGFCVAIFFLNFGYFFYLLGYSGLITAAAAAIKRETDLAPVVPASRQPAVLPNRFRFNGNR
jgi:O-antigen ligase